MPGVDSSFSFLLFFLLHKPLPSFFLVCVYFVPDFFSLTFWFIFGFILPPPPPLPLFCDTASWDRSGRQPRSHTGQSTSHLNHFSQPVFKPVNPIMLHSETLPFPTHPTDLPTLQLPRSSSSLLHSPSPMFSFFSLWVQSRENNQWHLWIALTPITICRIFTLLFPFPFFFLNIWLIFSTNFTEVREGSIHEVQA